jgi:hypothetical protein
VAGPQFSTGKPFDWTTLVFALAGAASFAAFAKGANFALSEIPNLKFAYREKSMLGRPLSNDEVRYVQELA